MILIRIRIPAVPIPISCKYIRFRLPPNSDFVPKESPNRKAELEKTENDEVKKSQHA
jgi:hypothetical protein